MRVIRRTQASLLAICLAVVAPAFASAAFILDDFDDLAITTSPEMEEIIVTTPNVGGVLAQRRMQITGLAADPIAYFDSNSATVSALTANLESLHSRPGRQSLFEFEWDYSFAPSDVSQGGANDAIVFDFRSLAGNGFVPELGVLVWDNTDLSESYFAAVRNLPLSSGPVSVSIPFSSFTQRGGSPGLPDFTTVKRIYFDFFFQFPPSDVQWTAEVERIRFGRVPEPSSSLLLLICSACVVIYRRKSNAVRLLAKED